MGQAKTPEPSKLIVGLIFRDGLIKDKVLIALKRKFGRIDYTSAVLNFNYTDYYYPEFGQPLSRLFIAFRNLLSEDILPEIKTYTNRIEKRFTAQGLRQVNIDPGFLSLGKLILATTKDQQHRIYLRKGIFAEVTLLFRDRTFKPWEWTYPDYRTKEYIDIFNSIRLIYLQQVKKNLPVS